MILPFNISHLKGLDPVESPLPPGFAGIADAYRRLGPAFTLQHQDRILACGGVVLTSPTEGRGWAVVSHESHQFPITLTRTALCILQSLETAGLEQVAVLVGKKHQSAIRWAGILGFRPVPVEDETSGSANHIVLERRKPCPGISD